MIIIEIVKNEKTKKLSIKINEKTVFSIHIKFMTLKINLKGSLSFYI